jgi:ABC-type Fe3+ transport system permease subunit
MMASGWSTSVFGVIVAWVLVRYRFPGRRSWMPSSICLSPCRRPSRASR